MLKVYLSLGLEHISDWKAIDHIAFISVMCAIYTIKDWKKILYLATAFTLGHSFTLALSALNIIKFNSETIELLIPVTIMITATYNCFAKHRDSKDLNIYIMIGIFGLIHGLGFSNYFSSFLLGEESIILPLLYFNLGVELGQFVIIFLILILSSGIIRYTKIEQKSWTLFLSGIGFGVAVKVLLDVIN